MSTRLTCQNSTPGSPVGSIQPMTDEAFEDAFIFTHGRKFSRRSDCYILPADEEEILRLDLQHAILKSANGGSRYCGPVPEVLGAPDPTGRQKAILDLGCGTGKWAAEMANEFPHCEVVGVDLSPIQSIFRDNCRFEVDDINLGIDHFDDAFDLIHLRHISSGIKDYQKLVSEIGRILRPGGMVLVQEFDYCVYDSGRNFIIPITPNQPLPAITLGSVGPVAPAMNQSLSWLPITLRVIRDSMQTVGGTVDAASRIDEWLNSQDEVFEVLGKQDLWLPTAPWYADPQTHQEEYTNRLGSQMRINISSFVSASLPLLFTAGVPPEVIRVLEDRTKTEMELEDGRTRTLLRVHMSWARKRTG